MTPRTSHFVTAVNGLATSKRFAFNGWWTSEWYPSVEDDLEEILSTPSRRAEVTDDQYYAVEHIVNNPEEYNVEPERAEALSELFRILDLEMYETETKPYEVAV